MNRLFIILTLMFFSLLLFSQKRVVKNDLLKKTAEISNREILKRDLLVIYDNKLDSIEIDILSDPQTLVYIAFNKNGEYVNYEELMININQLKKTNNYPTMYNLTKQFLLFQEKLITISAWNDFEKISMVKGYTKIETDKIYNLWISKGNPTISYKKLLLDYNQQVLDKKNVKKTESNFNQNEYEMGIKLNFNKICDTTNTIIFPYSIIAYNNIASGLGCSKRSNRRIIIYFSGNYNSNCMEFNAITLADSAIQANLINKYIFVNLITDDKTKFPKPITSEFTGKKLYTIGEKNLDYQISKFNSQKLPFFVILDSNEKLLYSHELIDNNSFLDFLINNK